MSRQRASFSCSAEHCAVIRPIGRAPSKNEILPWRYIVSKLGGNTARIIIHFTDINPVLEDRLYKKSMHSNLTSPIGLWTMILKPQVWHFRRFNISVLNSKF